VIGGVRPGVIPGRANGASLELIGWLHAASDIKPLKPINGFRALRSAAPE
jgi:hypothetical protein